MHLDHAVTEIAPEEPQPESKQSRKQHSGRKKHRRIEPYTWLAAGAVGVGIAAAMSTGAGVAYADDGAGSDSSASSSSSSGDTSAKSTTSTKASLGAEPDKKSSTSDAGDGVDSPGSAKSDSDEADSDETAEAESELSEEISDRAEQAEELASERTEEAAADLEKERPGKADSDRAERGDEIGGGNDTITSVPEVDPSTTEAAPIVSIDSPSPSASSTKVSVDTSRAERTAQTSSDAKQIAHTAAVAAPAPTTFGSMLQAMLLNFQRQFFNKLPTANPVQSSGQASNGSVTGTVGATDADGDPLEVTLSQRPKGGEVVVHADGSYVYTPTAALLASGGTDTFTVLVRETNASSHTHGLSGLLNNLLRVLGGGKATPSGTISQVVTVTIKKAVGQGSPDQGIPEPGPITENPNGYDSGLSEPFKVPDKSTGRTHNILDYGATSNMAGDNDAAAIQRAINAAQAGDSVYMPDGVYHIKSTIVAKAGVSLIGQSQQGTVLASAFSSMEYMFSNPYAVIYVAPSTNNLTISSFTITQASGKVFNAGVTVGSESGGPVSRIAIKDLFIERHRRFGIQLENANNVLVDGNVIKNASALDGGGSGYGVLISGDNSYNNWIKNNTVGPTIRHGILIQQAHHNLVEHNTVTGAVSGAIDLHGEDEYSNEIRYNTVSDCVRNGTTVSPNGAGIEIGEYSGVIGTDEMHDNSGANNWIHHNVVYNCSCGIAITNNSNYAIIEGNVLYNNLDAGIQAVHAPLNNLTIRRNSIYNNGSGILLNDVVNALVEDNIIRDNRYYGIWTNAGVTQYLITGNTLLRNAIDILLGSENGQVRTST